ncbi:MAG TPA: transporter substrate-binding domain-containing protein [Acholeplasmataceae bacterium]|jgi:ABC-type amino acid transport substrate-binding protein|nr:transporter substrate-binding domain-containing protein [Acholeplasmataceae bacterium]
MKKVLILVFVMLVGLLTGCSKQTFDFEKGILVVGLEAAYAPFNWMEIEKTDTNHPLQGMNAYVEGYDVQIAKRLAEDLELELVIKMVDWDGLILALQSGMIDVVIAGMSPTEERKEQINFTDAYYESEHVVIVRKDGKYSNAQDINDFSGAKIIGQKLTIYDKLAEQLHSHNSGSVHQTPLSTIPEIVNAIKTGVSDVTVVEKPVALSIVNNNQELKIITLATAFEVEEYEKIVSIGVRKEDTKLLEALNNSLAKITKTERDEIMLQATGSAPEE